MKQNPLEVRLIQGEEIREDINTNCPTLNLQVDEEKVGKQYALHFLRNDGENLKGHSVLNFKIK